MLSKQNDGNYSALSLRSCDGLTYFTILARLFAILMDGYKAFKKFFMISMSDLHVPALHAQSFHTKKIVSHVYSLTIVILEHFGQIAFGDFTQNLTDLTVK